MQADRGECVRRVFLSEGGYINDPRDPGGPTNWGITLADARLHWKPNATAEDVRAMPRSVAERIYKEKYWDALSADSLPAGVDYAVFDYGVNSGIGRAGRVLRAVTGLPSNDWRVDATVLDSLGRVDPQHVVDAICQERLAFLKRLPGWPHYGVGWSKRVAAVWEYSDHLAQASTAAAPQHPETNDASGKAYGDDVPIDAQPVPEPLPGFLQPKPSQSATVFHVGTSAVSSLDPPATPMAPEGETRPRASLGHWRPWAAFGLGSSGALDGLSQANDYASELSMAKFNLEQLNAAGALHWTLHHPVVLLPIVGLTLGFLLWQEHQTLRQSAALIKRLEAK